MLDDRGREAVSGLVHRKGCYSNPKMVLLAASPNLMKSLYDHLVPVAMCFMVCLTLYLCVDKICKTRVAVEGIHKGIIGVKAK